MSYYSNEKEQDRLQKMLEECLAENDDEQIELKKDWKAQNQSKKF